MLAVMTGGTRGLGRVAAEQMAIDGAKLMGVRALADVPSGWSGRAVDLANLATVRAFVDALPGEPVSHLILNAGVQLSTASRRTVDGFETTFATNHLAHYLLLRLLMPRLAAGARIVITSSGTHDPREKAGVPAPRHADAIKLANPDRDPDRDGNALIGGMRAYSASKLCNLLTARHLAASEDANRGGWSIVAYDPGLTPGTGLIRNQAWIVRTLVWPILPLIVPLSKGMNHLVDAGRGLSELATAARVPDRRVYAALRKGRLTWPDPSELARDDEAARRLWEDSAELVGLTQAT